MNKEIKNLFENKICNILDEIFIDKTIKLSIIDLYNKIQKIIENKLKNKIYLKKLEKHLKIGLKNYVESDLSTTYIEKQLNFIISL